MLPERHDSTHSITVTASTSRACNRSSSLIMPWITASSASRCFHARPASRTSASASTAPRRCLARCADSPGMSTFIDSISALTRKYCSSAWSMWRRWCCAPALLQRFAVLFYACFVLCGCNLSARICSGKHAALAQSRNNCTAAGRQTTKM